MKKFAVSLLAIGVVVVFGMTADVAEAGGKHRGPHFGHGWSGNPHDHWGHHHPGWRFHGRRMWVAKAKNIRGAVYKARGRSPKRAVQKALNKCYFDSFFPDGCRIINVRKVFKRWYGFVRP